jgi:hypothetical protein
VQTRTQQQPQSHVIAANGAAQGQGNFNQAASVQNGLVAPQLKAVHKLEIKNLDEFSNHEFSNPTLELINGSVADTLRQLVNDNLGDIIIDTLDIPRDDVTLTGPQKSAYICYAFYEIAMWKRDGQNVEKLPQISDVGTQAVSHAVKVLTENIDFIPAGGEAIIKKYISQLTTER